MAEPNKRQTVTVACKMPHGFHMQLTDKRMETPPQGGKEYVVHFPVGESVMIAGVNAGHPDGSNPGGRKVAGYGLTEVDAEFYGKWAEQKAAWPPLANGWVFAHANPDKTLGQAKEQADLKTGMEPIDPNKLPAGIEKA